MSTLLSQLLDMVEDGMEVRLTSNGDGTHLSLTVSVETEEDEPQIHSMTQMLHIGNLKARILPEEVTRSYLLKMQKKINYSRKTTD